MLSHWKQVTEVTHGLSAIANKASLNGLSISSVINYLVIHACSPAWTSSMLGSSNTSFSFSASRALRLTRTVLTLPERARFKSARLSTPTLDWRTDLPPGFIESGGSLGVSSSKSSTSNSSSGNRCPPSVVCSSEISCGRIPEALERASGR
jgi:hypothetical protein